MSSEKLWGGRFTKTTNILVEEFTASIKFDYRLAEEDIAGSIAHVQMLARQEIIQQTEADEIIAGLQQIEQEILAEEFQFSVELEDIHMNIEKRLIELIGPVGGKLHTARSRNDQVALDLHLYMKRQVKQLAFYLADLIKAFLTKADETTHVIMPGYTHLQRAQPVLFSHHMMAYAEMFLRDLERLQDSWKRIDLMPLGAGALAGTSFPIDRQYVADQLGFAELYRNSMDAVSDRDYLLEFHANASIMMMHLSRISEELIIWTSSEFNFVELDDSYCTGSSIMPQKKNPDVAELVRGKTGRVYGNLLALLTTLKALPLTYNKDMQEDKEGLFDTLDTLNMSLILVKGMIETMSINKQQMRLAVEQDFSNATDYADYLVGKGIPFREAHEIVGKTVLYAINQNKYLLNLTLAEFKTFSPLIDEDIYAKISPLNVVESRESFGGTSSITSKRNIMEAQNKLLDLIDFFI